MAGLAVIGWPGWDGALLSLDLVVFEAVPVSDSLWGLGPDLPRRSPLLALVGLLSPPFSGVFLVHLWMVAIVALAFVGMQRRLGSLHPLAGLGAGLLYAWSPFLLTRIGVGHLGFATAYALLPWSADVLLRPSDDLGRTWRHLVGFALCGYFGALLAGPLVLVGLLADRGRRGLSVLGVSVASQLPWLAPAMVGLRGSPDAASSVAFSTDARSVIDAILLVGGYGFWQRSNQIGVRHAGAMVIVLTLVALAVIGHRRSVNPNRGRLLMVALLALGVAWVSAIPELQDGYARATGWLLLAPFREGQRLAALFLLWLLPNAARGLAALVPRRPAVLLVLPATAVVLVGGSLLGLDGRVRPVDVPAAWDRAAEVSEVPGTTLAMPFNQYFDVEIAGDRRVHNPLPFLLHGDVLSSHDPELPDGGLETADQREVGLSDQLRELDSTTVDMLVDLGVRHIVLLPDVAAVLIDPQSIPDATVVLEDPTIAMVELDRWTGEVVTDSGRSFDTERVVPFLTRLPVELDEPAVWRREASAGWFQGRTAVERTEQGLLRLTGTSRTLIYWPGVLIATLLLIWSITTLVLIRPFVLATLGRPRIE